MNGGHRHRADSTWSCGEPKIPTATVIRVGVDELSGTRVRLGLDLLQPFVMAVVTLVEFAPELHDHTDPRES
jgi:hypothetical protein